MILVDSSVWVRHFRRSAPHLVALLNDNMVLTHPMVTGELACGNLPRRREVLGLFRELPSAVAASDTEVLELIEHHRLMGRGIGYVDVHLLAAALLTADASIWTFDARLASAASALSVAHTADAG
ncbi:PIN domain-containing protein [soil metagenome]